MSETVLEEAERIVNGERQARYGPPIENLTRIAEMWSAYLGKLIRAEDVCHMMVLVKVARARTCLTHRDNMVDIAGYARLLEMLLD